jgi:hypothetical protein
MGWRGCFLPVVLLLASPAFPQENRLSAATDRPPAISFEGLIGYLRQGARDAVSDAMVVKLIENFGLAFRPTADQLSTIRSARAPLTILTALESARIPAAPAPGLKNGALSVTCAPVDCDIWANDKPLGRSAGGVLPWVVLAPGRITITAASRNYDAAEGRREVVLQAGEMAHVAFRFKPSPAFLAELGNRLFRQMTDAIGGSEAKPPETIRASGALYIRDDSGTLASWSVVAWIRSENVIRLELSRLQERYELIQRGTGFSWTKRPRKKEAEQLEEAAAQLAGSLLSRRLASLKAAGLAIAACEPVDEATPRFCVRGPEATYTVTLDSSSRPGRIDREHAEGARDATFLYSDYSQDEGLLCPKVIQVLFTGSKWGIEARFSTIRRDAD